MNASLVNEDAARRRVASRGLAALCASACAAFVLPAFAVEPESPGPMQASAIPNYPRLMPTGRVWRDAAGRIVGDDVGSELVLVRIEGEPYAVALRYAVDRAPDGNTYFLDRTDRATFGGGLPLYHAARGCKGQAYVDAQGYVGTRASTVVAIGSKRVLFAAHGAPVSRPPVRSLMVPDAAGGSACIDVPLPLARGYRARPLADLDERWRGPLRLECEHPSSAAGCAARRAMAAE